MAEDTRVCPPCGAPLAGSDVRRKYCSDRCKEWARLHPGAIRPTAVGRRCLYVGCKKPLDHRRIDVNYCDQLCYNRATKDLPALVEQLCECGTSFVPSNLRQHFCSKPCSQRAAGRKWRVKNPIYVREVQHRRRAQKNNHPDTVKISARDWRRLCHRYSDCCAYCGVTVSQLHMDHVVPINRGGRHGIGNVLPACLKCNISKHDKLLVVWKYARTRSSAPLPSKP